MFKLLNNFKSVSKYVSLFLFFTSRAFSFQILPLSPDTKDLGYGDWDIKTDGESLVIKQFIKPGNLVFDVGAYVGDWSHEVLLLQPNTKILAFEPIPENFESCKNIFSSYENVQVFNNVLSDQDGILDFYFCTDSGFLSSLYFRDAVYKYHSMETLSVQAKTMENFCIIHNIQKIDFVKIDAEGSELKILIGAEKLLKNHQIRALQFEYGGACLDSKSTLKEIVTLLTDYGYLIFRIIPAGLVHISKWESFLENFELSNYFAICQEDMPSYNPVIFCDQ